MLPTVAEPPVTDYNLYDAFWQKINATHLLRSLELMKKSKPRRPQGRWTYYILYEDILWPCPVRWEWESSYGGWLPFYYAPTLEFVAGDPSKATKVTASRKRVR